MNRAEGHRFDFEGAVSRAPKLVVNLALPKLATGGMAVVLVLRVNESPRMAGQLGRAGQG